jgi:hypothetical protein
MKLISLRAQLSRKTLAGILVVLALVIIGLIFYLQKTGKFGQFLAALPAKVAVVPEEEVPPVEEEIKLAEEVKPPVPKIYEQEAKKGEGITHLARKTLKQYLEETKFDTELTSEHKIFIEDYLQNKTGDRWLKLGEKVSFSEELIVEAINEALKLTPEQLENLTKFSALVPGL